MQNRLTRSIFSILFFIFLSNCLLGQGTVRGTVIDEFGDPVIGATIIFEDNIVTGTATDFDGIYSIELPDNFGHVAVIEYLGYKVIKDTFLVSEGKVLIKDYVLVPESEVLEEVVVVAKVDKSKDYHMEKVKLSSTTTLDYVSSDIMKKVGDSNVASAISRASGVSTNGSFFSVRGIGDRYVRTTINGSIIPTLDPFTNNVKLDLFPTSLVDNIVITKTQSPELPGDWSAAYISVETKDYPDQLMINFSSSIGYNPQTTFREIISNATSPTDWLGFDNGFRNVDHTSFSQVNESPSRFDEYMVLGLEEYYKSLGIEEAWANGSQVGQVYSNLGLVELGLLGENFFYDTQSITEAENKYANGTFREDAFRMINQDAESANKAFANNWNVTSRNAPINFSQNFTIGNQTKLFGKTLGFIFGFRYSNNVRFDPNSEINRTETSQLTAEGEAAVETSLQQEFASYSNGWTGLANINYKLNENNAVSFLFMPNMKGVNSIRKGIDETESTVYKFAYLESQFYEERQQLVYQFKSRHFIPRLRSKLNLFASYTNGESTAPDFKSLDYFSDNGTDFLFDKTISNIRRNFRFLNENVLDSRLTIDIPLGKVEPGKYSKLKLGASYLDKNRDFTQFDYLLRFSQGVAGTFSSDGLESFFTDEKFQFQKDGNGDTNIPLYYILNEDPANDVIGHSKVYSAYAMLDKTITDRIRVSGGLRTEYTDIFTDVRAFSELGYSADDERRVSLGQSFVLSPGVKKQFNILPSVNILYKLKLNQEAPMNLRLNFSKTIARPSIREYTETIVRDFELNSDVFGNAELEIVEIENYDIRWESFFKSGDNLTISLFYKNFDNHIELLRSNFGFTWANADRSYVYGVEIEGKKQLGKFFDFRVNTSVVNSFTSIEDRRLEIMNGIKSWVTIGTVERTMFGQAPYVINGILNYSNSSIGLNSSLSYNIQGPKLVLTSTEDDPDIFELPRHLLNFKVNKTLTKHFSLSVTIRNVLNAPIRRSYGFDEGFLLDFDRFTYGTNFILGLSYKLQ